MVSKAETSASKLDIVKLIAALLVVAVAVAGFYHYAEQPLLYRVLGVLAAVVIAIGVASQTQRGRGVWAFLQDVQVEVRKVVWPTRRETVQTTFVVMAMVVAVALFLWTLDSLLGWIVRLITGIGS